MKAVRTDGWQSLPIFEIADFGSGDSISVARLSKRSAIAPVRSSVEMELPGIPRQQPFPSRR